MAEKQQTSRTWATIVYPESSADDWIDTLEQLHIPCYVSPLHDQEKGKSHYHVVMIFQGQKNQENIKSIVKVFGGVGQELVHHKKAYLRYLCHLDSLDKHKYDISEVKVLSGAEEYKKVIDDEEVSKYDLMAEMVDWCKENTVVFADLVDYAKKERSDWFRVLVDKNSHLIWEYIKSMNWRNQFQDR